MIGRTEEINILKKAMNSDKPELIAVIGRRRVGKTYLIRQFFGDDIDFEMVGLKDGKTAQQLRNFTYSLETHQKPTSPLSFPIDWLEAFHQLRQYLDSLKLSRKKVVFIDELPWAATSRSDFLTGFSYFWNSYASKNDIVVVICGSARAWMIKRIINNKGGLHNRVTRKLLLRPFSLAETEAYFKVRNMHFERYQLLQLYMAMGGVPHYLDQVEKGKTAIQNIDDICFSPQGLLRTEFDNLYSSLFTNPERYERIVEVLSQTWKGMSRVEIIEKTEIKDGGGLTTILKELEQSGFISSYVPFQRKKKDTLFRLSDNYSLFYLKYIKGIPANEAGDWRSLSQTQTWKSWSGYAFENICLQHIAQIKTALKIGGIHTRQYSFLSKNNDENKGVQIDLLIDRMDSAISLAEIKFYNTELSITKSFAEDLSKKVKTFQRITKTKKQLFTVLITTYGITDNDYAGIIDNLVTMDDLFLE